MSDEYNYAFGSFILRADPLRLLRDGIEVPLGARALAILHALVRHPGQALSKHMNSWRCGQQCSCIYLAASCMYFAIFTIKS